MDKVKFKKKKKFYYVSMIIHKYDELKFNQKISYL